MTSNEVHKRYWIVTFIAPNQLKRMKKNQRKLSDLEERIESFPPEKVAFSFRKGCRQYEISVDDDVNCRVDEPKERGVTTCKNELKVLPLEFQQFTTSYQPRISRPTRLKPEDFQEFSSRLKITRTLHDLLALCCDGRRDTN